MKKTLYDVIIIGAGASGLTASIFCVRLGLKALLLESKGKIGAKILMSGGNRCNVTNAEVTQKDYGSETPYGVRSVLHAFPPKKTVRFFKELGVPLAQEQDGKYFPATQSAQTVLNALLDQIKKLKITVRTSSQVRSISFQDNAFTVTGDSFQEKGAKILLCTGGLSYPTSGSDGAGYQLARNFGHSIVQTTAGLTPFLTRDNDWKKISGVSLPCKLTLWYQKKKKVSFEGPFLFTHFGFSGPTVLNISRYWARQENREETTLTACFLPSLKEEKCKELWIKAEKENPTWKIDRFLAFYLPQRFIQVFLRKIKMDATKILNQVSKKERNHLIDQLFKYPLEVTGTYGYKKAEITAGGIDLKDLSTSTMQSKLQPGLFFSGEILDADGRIGGFNFQWAWATAYLAAHGIAQQNSS